MRALYLVVLITLCLPLQAGDPANLNTAVEMFRSPHPAARAEGSKIADQGTFIGCRSGHHHEAVGDQRDRTAPRGPQMSIK